MGDDALLDFWEQSQSFDAALSVHSGVLEPMCPVGSNQPDPVALASLMDIMDAALQDDSGDLNIFALPVGAVVGGKTGRTWPDGLGHEGLVLHELQLRAAAKASSGFTG